MRTSHLLRTRYSFPVGALLLSCALLCSAFVAAPERGLLAAEFVRGDTDASGSTEITDAIGIFGHLFLGDPADLLCRDAADVDDTGTIEITDGIYLLGYLFLGGPAPPEPFGACGGDPTDDGLDCASMPPCQDSGLLRSALERDLSPQVEEGEVAALVAGNTAFALDLYGRVRRGGGNLFFSPHSISEALAMAYAGAREETARQMAEALRFSLGEERLHPAINWLDLELSRRGQGAAGHAGGGFQLRVVNATWGQGGYSFLPGYLDTLASSYDAGLRILDFMADPEAARATINAWVSAETADRIRDLLQPGTILPTTRLVLTNAIYFSAAWAEPFPKSATKEGDFHLLDGSVVKAPLMSHRADFGYASGDGYEAVELLYDGKELSMVVLLPAGGTFEEFEANLDAPKLGGILAALHPADIHLTIPRFSSVSELNLVETLRALGIRDAFVHGTADFSGIDGTRDLFISGVVHKAFVSVDEDGTEAAAATAVVIGVVSIPEFVQVDRPFIFLIRDIPTGTILFLGRVLSP